MANWPDFHPDRLLPQLVAHGVDFVVIGGIAMVAHGSARVTHDLDITYSPDQPNLDALGRAMTSLRATLRGVDDDVPFVADGTTLRRTTILTLDTDAGPIDLLSAPPGAPLYAELRGHAEPVTVWDTRILVASLDDLELMKRAAGRAKDALDLEEIAVIRRLRARG